ncbi:MAG: hypothetical protein AAGF11_18340 [Myxococcota bacterium]
MNPRLAGSGRRVMAKLRAATGGSRGNETARKACGRSVNPIVS